MAKKKLICPKCKSKMDEDVILDQHVCPKCGFKITKEAISQSDSPKEFYITNSMEVEIKDEESNKEDN